MTDHEKVINGLKHCDFGVSDTCYEKECPYYQSPDCTDELKNDILVLLKEQEPKAPIYSYAKYGDLLAHCPSCEIDLPAYSIYGKSNFCYRCGQAVK